MAMLVNSCLWFASLEYVSRHFGRWKEDGADGASEDIGKMLIQVALFTQDYCQWLSSFVTESGGTVLNWNSVEAGLFELVVATSIRRGNLVSEHEQDYHYHFPSHAR